MIFDPWTQPSRQPPIFGPPLPDRKSPSDFLEQIKNLKEVTSVVKASIHKENNSYIVQIEVPGLSRDDITIEVKNRTLTVSGSKRKDYDMPDSFNDAIFVDDRNYGNFQRKFDIPESPKDITASLKDGILKIIITKNEDVRTIIDIT